MNTNKIAKHGYFHHFHVIVGLLLMVVLVSSCNSGSSKDIKSRGTGEVITDMTADFDGEMDSLSDLEDLVETAWGTGWLGLHRGHGAIEDVLSMFLGITHDEMHVLMDEGLNLAGICEKFGFSPDSLVETLTASFLPYIKKASNNGVISEDEIPAWREKVRDAIERRVHWTG